MKQLSTFFLALLFSANISAQAPLTADDIMTTIGTQFDYYIAFPTDPGDPGANQIWDFSNLTIQMQQQMEIDDMESTGVESNFPEANIQWVHNFGVSSSFYAIDSDSLTYYGQYEDGGYQLIHTDPNTLITFPASFGTTFQDTFVSDYIIDGGSGHVAGVYDATVDGTGTLILPWGEIQNVFRVTASDIHTEDFDVGPTVYEASYIGTNTQWFAAGYPGALLTVTSGVVSVPEINLTQEQHITTYLGNFTFVGVDEVEIVNKLNVWPVPAKDEVNISFEIQSAEDIILSLFDISGKELLHWTAMQTEGFSYSSKLDVSNLTPGFYMLQLKSEEGVQGVKITVQ